MHIELKDKFLSQFRESITKIKINREDKEEHNKAKVISKGSNKIKINRYRVNKVNRVNNNKKVNINNNNNINYNYNNQDDFKAYQLFASLYKQVKEHLKKSDRTLFLFI